MDEAIEGLADQLREGDRIGAAAGARLPHALGGGDRRHGRLGDGRRAAARAGRRPTARCRSRASAASASPAGPAPARWSSAPATRAIPIETLSCAEQARTTRARTCSGSRLRRQAGRARAASGVRPSRACRAACSRGRRWGICSARWPAPSALPAGRAGIARRVRRGRRRWSTATRRPTLGERLADDDPADLRRRPAGGRGLPLEDAAERERQDARVQPCLPRARPQRDRGLGGRTGRPVRGGVLSRPGSAQAETRRMIDVTAELIARRRGARRGCRRPWATRSAAPRLLAGRARRLGQLLRGAGAGHRSDARRAAGRAEAADERLERRRLTLSRSRYI